MYRLTDLRFAKAEEILERHLAHIHAGHHIDALGMEMELRECWNIGYQELKPIMEQLMARSRYTLLAASYMENSNGGQVVCEFQAPLAKLYGANYYAASDYDQKRDQFWARAFSRKAS